MSRTESVELTTLCMIHRGEELLLQNRVKTDWRGYCFPGGHVEYKESFTEAVIREVWEETGLTVENPVLCGTKQFQTLSGARYVVFFYKASKFHGALQSSAEGEVYWLPRAELAKQKLAPDMMEMVQVMESPTLSEFYYRKVDGNWKLTLY